MCRSYTSGSVILGSYSYFTTCTSTLVLTDFVLVLVHSFIHSKIFNALCPLIELIGQVLSFVDSPTDINGDGCFTDDLGPFGTFLSITPVGLAGW